MIKRTFDILVSASLVFLLSPIVLLVACLVAAKLGRPIIFKQPRPGLKGEVFELYKFRSMKDLTGADGSLLPDSERLTSFGKKLRASSLDELPSLLNILRGEMSLVGPRPLLVRYLPYYNSEQAKRHDVLPGLTGWAQINGRNNTSWEERFNLDVWYVENHTFSLDIKILLLTIKKVIAREGISPEDSVTMPAFEGSKIDQSELES